MSDPFKIKGYTVKMAVTEKENYNFTDISNRVITIYVTQEIFDNYEPKILDAGKGLIEFVKKKRGKEMNKFKIGDKVRTLTNTEIDNSKFSDFEKYMLKNCKSRESTIVKFAYIKENINWYELENNFFASEDFLELVSTSEELAVKKFKEELKDKINNKIKENIDNNIINFETLTKKEILELLR